MNNMSEEEIIEYLKKVIKTIQESDMLFDEPVNIRCGIKMEGAIQGLLDLYKELKSKINEYEKQLDLDYVEENYIPKSKVKELDWNE